MSDIKKINTRDLSLILGYCPLNADNRTTAAGSCARPKLGGWQENAIQSKNEK